MDTNKPAAIPTPTATPTVPAPAQPPKWYDKDIKEGLVRPSLNFVGGPVRMGMVTAGLGMLPFYLFARKRKLEHPFLRTMIFGGLTGAMGYGATGGSFTKNGYQYPNTKAWVDRLIGAPKTASDGLNRADLFDAVADLPGYNIPQKNFLAMGVAASPGNDSSVTLPELADGFNSMTGAVTGGLLPMATRAIEGAIIGSAFGHLIGAAPSTRKWITGLSAVADSLYGNRLINTVGQLTSFQ